MRKLLNVCAVTAALLACPACFAQDQKPAAAPVMPEKLTITLTAQQLALIGSVLDNLPKRAADPLILDLNQQIEAQIRAATEAAAKKAGDAKAPAKK